MFAAERKCCDRDWAGLAIFMDVFMPENSGPPPCAPADMYMQYAREAMELSERTNSIPLREELLKLAMKWLRVAEES